MIDKNNYNDDKDPQKNNEGVSFSYDLDLDKDIELSDNFDLSEDDLLITDDIEFNQDADKQFTDNVKVNNAGNQSVQAPGIVDFIKSYGLVLLIGAVFIYFGLKYSISTIFEQNTVTTEPTTAVISPEQISTENQLNFNVDPVTGSSTNINEGSALSSGTQDGEVDISNMPEAAQDLFGYTSAATTDSRASSVPPTASVIESPVSPAATNNSADLFSGQLSQLSSEMNEKISNLTMTVESLSTKVNAQSAGVDNNIVADLQQQVKTLNNNVEQVVLYVQEVGKALGALSEQVRKQQSVLSTSVDTNAAPLANKQQSKIDITVEAIITGRAWLRTAQGEQLTVAKGDQIPGYGRVIEINSKTGTVTTDGGIVLTQ
jgi:hypothetical protein